MQKNQTMDKNDLLDKLSFLNDKEKVTSKLYFHYSDENVDLLLEAPTDNESVDQKLADLYTDSIKTKFNEHRKFQVLNIEAVEEFDTNATYYYYNKNYPESLKFLFGGKKGRFVFSKHSYANIKGYLINLTYGTDTIDIYKYRHNFDIHIKPTLLTLIRIDNELESPSNESIIINEKFDYAIVDDNLIAMSLSTLERKTKFDERIKLQSAEVINTLKHNDVQIVEEYSKLEELLSVEFNFAKKLKSIDFTALLWSTPFKDIKKRIEARPALVKYLKFNKTGDKFSITSKQAAKIFFKLCNDKVMESILSGIVHLVDDVESVDFVEAEEKKED